MSSKRILKKAKKASEENQCDKQQVYWKLLIVDDEHDMHVVTKLALARISIIDRQLDIISAYSSQEAKTLLSQHQDIAMALIDVVMESENAGLDLVRYIRDDLKMNDLRIVIRTGQAGMVPERFVIEHYDIDDFKEKTELTSQKLYTCIRCGIKAYNDVIMSKEKSRQVLHAERLATLGTLAASVAHEINNPNTFIASNIAFVEQVWETALPILRRHIDDKNDKRLAYAVNEMPDTLNGIREGSRRITIIVDAIKNYGKTKDGNTKQSFPLTTPIADADILLRTRLKHINFEINVPDTLVVIGDRYELSQVFINLFNNSLDAMEDNAQEYGKKLVVAAERNDNTIKISVRDNGSGIEDNKIEDVFEPFFTTKGKTKGTGLGLSIVADIIENHNGSIVVQKIPAGGIEFQITLPSGNNQPSVCPRDVA